MPATHIDEITDEQIRRRLKQVEHVWVSSCGSEPVDTEYWSGLALDCWACVGSSDVHEALQNELMGENAQQEIDMAISIACEPVGFPENAAVEVRFATEED